MQPRQFLNNAQVGYCTNVHPGVTLDQIKRNLETETLAVKQQVSPDAPMGVGVWLSKSATKQLIQNNETSKFRNWLNDRDLVPFTINAFPLGNFHQSVVKHRVYKPSWADRRRLEYTQDVASILANLLPSGSSATISTLPLGWPNRNTEERFFRSAATHFLELAEGLETLNETHQVSIRVCMEPEPGCVLDTCDDVVQFFDRYLFVTDKVIRSRVNRYLGVCHDICHSAVMFEPQSVALDRYAAAGITVGKVQVSSAVEVDFEALDDSSARETLQQLSTFAEPRYLHQSCIQKNNNVQFFEDLVLAIRAIDSNQPTGKWRVHFHVPIHEASFGLIGSTQSHVCDCLDWFKKSQQHVPHFEVETYAWNVLPKQLQPKCLADGIADEMAWFKKQWNT